MSCGLAQINGKGSSARVLQGDLPACGPSSGGSFVHIVNSILLPFVPSDARTPGGAAGTAFAQSTTPALPAAAAPGKGELRHLTPQTIQCTALTNAVSRVLQAETLSACLSFPQAFILQHAQLCLACTGI